MNRDVRNASKLEAAAMETDGKTRREIATRFNVSNGTITNWLGKKMLKTPDCRCTIELLEKAQSIK